jgi:hypothetical protein
MGADRAGSETVTGTAQASAPWAILLVVVAQVVPKLWLFASYLASLPINERIAEVLFVVLPVPFAAVGALIAARRRGHRIGWLLLGGALAISTAQLSWGYVAYGLDADAPLPGAAVVGWVGNWIPWPALAAFALLLLLFPDGRLPSPRWRPVAWAMVGWCVVIMAFLAVYPELLAAPELDNPFGLSGDAGAAMRRLQASPAIPLISIPLVLASAAAPLVRFRHTRGVQRQQLKWFAYAVGLLVVLLVLPSWLLPGWARAVTVILPVVAVWGIAAAIGIAVLRYRLYAIDRIVNRTLVYGLLTAVLAGVYAALVLVLGQLFGGIGGQPPTWVVAGATLAVAALFQPARRRIQHVVDRRFNRRRYDMAQTIEAFSARLRDQVDLDTLSTELLAVVDQTMEPTQVSLWLRPAAPASSGAPRSQARPTTWPY